MATILLAAGLAAMSACRPEEEAPRVSPDALVVADNLGPAPDFTLVDLDGKTVSLSDFKGQAVILNFWAPSVDPCVRETPHFIELYEAHRDAGLVVIGISVGDSPDAARAFVAEHSVDYPILQGDESVVRGIAEAYGGVSIIPTTFLIDAERQIVRRFMGYHDKPAFEASLPDILPPSADSGS
ncbi:TlpA family protein disulfide reductase [Candidatus Poribacteria bacterium]|nr:TlpA family protein disulfide reductase [Candidatus Poribacteria bacterium]